MHMETKVTNKTAIDKVNKILEDKRIVQAFLRGEISIDVLHERGLKLAMPI